MVVIRKVAFYILGFWAIVGFGSAAWTLIPDRVKESTNISLIGFWFLANGYLLNVFLGYNAKKPAVSIGCVGLLATLWLGSSLYFDGELFTIEGLALIAATAVSTAVIFATNSKFKDKEWFEMKDQ